MNRLLINSDVVNSERKLPRWKPLEFCCPELFPVLISTQGWNDVQGPLRHPAVGTCVKEESLCLNGLAQTGWI